MSITHVAQVADWSSCPGTTPGATMYTNVTQRQAGSSANLFKSIDSQAPSSRHYTLENHEPLSQFAHDHLIEPMQSLESKLNFYFQDIWQETGDERTNKLPFIGAGPWKLLYATLIYLYLIKWLLPRLMQLRQAFELNWMIRAYNLMMVLSNMWAFYHGARILSFGTKCFGCETINHQDYSPPAMELLHYGWLFFLSRLVEWLDTIFFVLRKKDKQVTKLHVFHHSFVPLISWTYLKYHPGYTVAFFPFVNSFVHSIMYTYYFLATFGAKLQPYLWWKRYLTSLQIFQFLLILVQLASIPITVSDKCQYPRGFLYVAFAGAILFLWLFYTYYLDTYTKQKGHVTHLATKATTKQQSGLDEKQKSNLISSSQPMIESMAVKKVTDRTRFVYRSRDEGASKALAETIENAIGSFCDFNEQTDGPTSTLRTKRKII